jgi:diguanylate cyclase (GGDEF)-like protein/PAS domain S-box-containing protein
MESAPKSKAAEVLRFDQSGDLLRRMMENAAVGTVLVGLDGRLLYVNTAFCQMLGHTRDEALALVLDDLGHPEDPACVRLLRRVLRGETEDHRGECRLQRRDGNPVWVEAYASLFRGERTGRPLYLLLQFIDIERRKQAEEALSYQEKRWNNALEASGQGVWEYDARRASMYYSPMWRKMRGIPLDAPIDDSQAAWLERLHPEDRERIRAIVGKQETGEDGFDTLEYRERHRDGHYIWILSRGRPVEWDAEGNPIRTVGTDTDITRLKAIEQQLAHSANHDVLTGLPNRAAFERALAAAVEALRHQQRSCALCFIDLDGFKPVNDSAGHAAGDALLRQVAETIRRGSRADDFAARIGGDEFGLILCDCNLEEARAVAQKIVDAIGGIAFAWNGRNYRIGASIGIARVGENAAATLAAADTACYAAKDGGRGRVELAPETADQ